VIDLHTHVLPGIDDGPADLAGSLELARAAVAAGTEVMAATPHIDHVHGVVPEEVGERAARLQAELDERSIPLRIVAGGEVAATRVFDLDEPELADVAIGDGPWVLLECPLAPGSILEPAVERVRGLGFEVLLAHPERSPEILAEPEQLERLVELGCLASITDASLRGRFGGPPREAALLFLERGLVHDVASDAHSAFSRAPGLREGLEAAGRELPGVGELAGWLTGDVPAAIVAGTAIPEAPAVELRRRRRGMGRLRRAR
jgi:protein-tyrosine phosphatase